MTMDSDGKVTMLNESGRKLTVSAAAAVLRGDRIEINKETDLSVFNLEGKKLVSFRLV
jgi:hypothetical protein